jgi:hypothetical protein
MAPVSGSTMSARRSDDRFLVLARRMTEMSVRADFSLAPRNAGARLERGRSVVVEATSKSAQRDRVE